VFDIERWKNPSIQRAALGTGAVLVLVASFFGVTWYLDRTPPQAAEATESTPSATPAVKSGPIVVHGTGDVNLDPRQLGLVRTSYDAPWSGVRDLFTSDDLTVVNLECAPSELGEPEDKEFTFRCPRGFEAMLRNGVEVTNQGNNHSGDYGKRAQVDGRRRLTHAGLAVVGSGRNAGEANTPALFELRGKKVAVLGFGGVVETPKWLATDTRPGVSDGYDVASMVRAVRAAEEVADIVVVTLHWGAERDRQPRADDIARARAMIDAGADAIFGHHAHVLQPLDFYKDRPIFYGLGNFVWPRGGPTAVAEVVFRPDGTIAACLLPGTISGGRPVLVGPTAC
jgi:hypothetical protein